MSSKLIAYYLLLARSAILAFYFYEYPTQKEEDIDFANKIT